jgi:HD-like signal output (HDOD) protein
VRSKQIEALERAEPGSPAETTELEQQAHAAHNLFNAVGILLSVTLAFGLVFFTIWIYRLASAARDARELIAFRGLVDAQLDEAAAPPAEPEPEPAAPTPAPEAADQPELLEPEPAVETPAAETPTAETAPPEPTAQPAEPPLPEQPEPEAEPAPMRASVTITPAGETISRSAVDAVFESLAPPDKERRYRLDLLRHAGLRYPQLPAETARLLDLVAQPKAYMHQLVREISREPVLAQRLIRLANTLYYSPPKPVRNLNHALVVLGAEGIRTGALAQAVHGAFDFALPLQVELWHGSIAVAVAAALVGRAVRHGRPDELYANGLVHVIGRMVLLKNRTAEYARLADLMKNEDVPAADVEREAFGFTSADVGAVAVAVWGLPRSFQGAVMYVDDLDAPGLAGFGREGILAATVLSAAAAIARKVTGVCAVPSDAEVDLAAHDAVRTLGLGTGGLDDIVQDLADMYAEHRGFL